MSKFLIDKRQLNAVRGFSRNFLLVKQTINVKYGYSTVSSDIGLSDKPAITLATKNGKISRSKFSALVKRIENGHKICDAHTALELIKSCGLHFIDLSPCNRQERLNHIFEYLLPEQVKLKYEQSHYEHYMCNTILNEHSFDAVQMARLMSRDQISLNQSISQSLTSQLCRSNQVQVAVSFLNHAISDESRLDLKFLESGLTFEQFLQSFLTKMTKTDPVIVGNLLAPLMGRYLINGDESKALKLFETLKRPTSLVYSSLVDGYLRTRKFNNARQILDEQIDEFAADELLEILLTQSATSAPSELNEMINHRLDSLNLGERETIFRFINTLMRLCKNGRYDWAFELTRRHFEEQFLNQHPTEMLHFNEYINVSSYFYKSLVDYSHDSSSLIVKYARAMDQLADVDHMKHLKCALYHSYEANSVECNLDLIRELKANNVKMKINFFLPLLAVEVKNFDRLCHSYNNGKFDARIEQELEFKRLESILKLIRTDFGCPFDGENLNLLLNMLRFDAESGLPKSGVTYALLAGLFRASQVDQLSLFNCCAHKILNYRIEQIKRLRASSSASNVNLKAEVEDDFRDLLDLIESLHVDFIEVSILDKLNSYMNELYRFDVEFIDLKSDNLANDPVVKLMDKLNQLTESTSLNEMNKNLNYFFKLKNVNFELAKTAPDRTHFQLERSQHTVEELMSYVKKCELEKKDPHPAIRRVVIKLCNRPNLVPRPIDLIQQLADRLERENQLTPLVCQELMYFYSRFAQNRAKANDYYQKLMTIMSNQSDEFYLDGSRLGSYVQLLVSNKEKISNVMNVFRRVKCSPANEPLVENILLNLVYKNVNGTQFKNLVEAMYASGMLGERNVNYGNWVMMKLIESKQIDDAFEHFVAYLRKYKLSLMEILMFKEYVKKPSPTHLVNVRTHQRTERKLMSSMNEFYENKLAHNFLFLAHILNGDLKAAQRVYAKNLNNTLDVQVLERLVDQLNSNPLVRRKLYNHLKRNLPLFCSSFGCQHLDEKINNILNKCIKD